RAVAERRDEARLEVARVAEHHAGLRRPELEVGGRAPDEREGRVDARSHAASMPERGAAARHPSTGGTHWPDAQRRTHSAGRPAPDTQAGRPEIPAPARPSGQA